jgi:hypothetical protein
VTPLRKTKPEIQGRRDRKTLEIKTAEENRRRKSTTFKPPDSNDFQNAADTGWRSRRNVGSKRGF